MVKKFEDYQYKGNTYAFDAEIEVFEAISVGDYYTPTFVDHSYNIRIISEVEIFNENENTWGAVADELAIEIESTLDSMDFDF